jgi:tight adherence protein B
MQQEKNRRLRFEEQLPEALDFMTRALRAGHGLSVAIGMVGDELPDPVGPEFKTVFEHIKLGMAFGDAMGQMAERINSSDLNFLVIALMIQRKTGGNLTELLTTLSKTVRERIKLKGKIRVLASEGKLSGIMIGSLPFALGGILSVLNPIYMSTLWTTTTGQMLMLVNLGMIFIGAVWMWKIVQIKV